jgi:pimeloyl-ACP methyl ester carboxylesterase
VRIHSQEWLAPSERPGLPIVFVPGGTGNAFSGEDLGRDAASGAIGGRPRALLCVSRRSTGESGAPRFGYTPRDFADDVHAAVAAAGYTRFLLFGHSMGVPISLEYALVHPDRVAALALGDTPAAYIDFKAAGTFDPLLKRRFEFSSWDDVYEDFTGRFDDRSRAPSREVFDRNRHRHWAERGGTIRPLLDRDGFVRTVEESVRSATEYWSRLPTLTCPVLLLKGTGAGWSPLSDDDIRRYQLALPSIVVDYIPGGHDLGLSADRRPLCDALGRLLRSVGDEMGAARP